MTIRTIKTTIEESERLYQNKTRGIFRSDHDVYHEGDLINFLAIKNKKPVEHKNNSICYVVTEVKNSNEAPLEKGYQYIGFRRK